jgi:hypothetical protein
MAKGSDNPELFRQVKALDKTELEDISFQALDTLQRVMKVLKRTGHEHLLSDVVVDTKNNIENRKKSLSEIRDASSIINQDTCSTMTKISLSDWKIHSPLLDNDISGDSAFDVIISYVKALEEMVMDKTYDKDIRAVMEIALNRAKENMDGNNAGRELFDKAGVKVWIEVRIQNNIPRWIVDSDEKGSTLIHRTDEDDIVRVISSMITNKFRENKKKES